MKNIFIFFLFSFFLFSQEDPFSSGDEAYSQGKFRDALKIYEAVALASSNPSVQADAYIRCALVHFMLGEKQETIISIEKALNLNPNFVPDPTIYNKDFIKLYEIALLRKQLSKLEPAEDPLSATPVQIPNLTVPENNFSIPLPEIELLPIKDETPFYKPVDKPPKISKENLPSTIHIEGEVTLSVLLDPTGKPKKAKVYQSDFPQFSNQILKDFAVWSFTAPKKSGQVVSTWASIILRFKSKYKWDIITMSFLPVEKGEKTPEFIKYNFNKDRVPQELIDKKFSDAYNIKDIDELPSLKKWDFNFEDFQGKETIKGILWVSKEGKVLGFRATQVQTPALALYLEKTFKENLLFTPPTINNQPTDVFLKVEINANYTLTEPKLLFSKNIKINLSDQ